MGMKKTRLFDYQQEMLDNIIKTLTTETSDSAFYNEKGERVREGNSVMVQMPTGTGKTYVMAAVVKWFIVSHDKGEVWLVAHRRELVEQMQQTLDRFCLAYGDNDEDMRAKTRIRVLSIQWLTRHMAEMEDRGCVPGLIVVDEAHHALAASYQDVFARNAGALKMGMTATPCRLKKASFGKLFRHLLTSPSTSDFILRGYLAPYNYVVIGKTSADQQIINTLRGRGSDGDYAVSEMHEKLNVPQAIQRLYNSVAKYADGKKGIVYAIDIDHAKAIAGCYSALGIRAVALDSKTPAKTRQQMVQAFRKGELDCLVNVNLFDEGFDCPDVEYIQMARPTLSLAKYLQMVGRGLRINKADPGKVCMIIDNVGNYRKFGYPDKPRNWTAMFAGLVAGKGAVPSYVKKMSGVIVADEDMVVVKKADRVRKKLTATQLEQYKQSVEPFASDDGMLMGLRTPDEVVMKPRYSHISKFHGDYAVFCLNYYCRLRGVIDRLGFVVVSPEYNKIKFLDAHTVQVWLPKGGTTTIVI